MFYYIPVVIRIIVFQSLSPQNNENLIMAIATLAAGCFWGVEQSFRQLTGVLSTRVGYCNGLMKDPTYKVVCTGKTGHAEAIEITFNPNIISYETLLNHFWQLHDPTTLNQQGVDIGTQYRSAIFYHDEQQQQIATNSKNILDASNGYGNPIVTEISPAQHFYPAEEYHQCYIDKKGKA